MINNTKLSHFILLSIVLVFVNAENAPVFIQTNDLEILQKAGTDVIILNVFMSTQNQDATNQSTDDPLADYHSSHIFGAYYFDLSTFLDPSSDYPQKLPTLEKFTAEMKKLGLQKSSRVILYDQGLSDYSAARLFWILRVFGQDNVSILDGGFKKWQAEKKPTVASPGQNSQIAYDYQVNSSLYRTTDQVEQLQKLIRMNRATEQLVDARNTEDFNQGFLQGAVNLPASLLQNRDGTVKSKKQIRSAVISKGIDPSVPFVLYDQTGLLSAYVFASLSYLEDGAVSILNGKWTANNQQSQILPPRIMNRPLRQMGGGN